MGLINYFVRKHLNKFPFFASHSLFHLCGPCTLKVVYFSCAFLKPPPFSCKKLSIHKKKHLQDDPFPWNFSSVLVFLCINTGRKGKFIFKNNNNKTFHHSLPLAKENNYTVLNMQINECECVTV